MAGKRSAVFARQRDMGAQMLEHRGWETPAAFSSEQEEVAQHLRDLGYIE